MQEASISLLQSFEDPKQTLIDIENKCKNNTPFTTGEYALFIIMNLIKEVEDVAMKSPDAFIDIKEITIADQDAADDNLSS